MGKLAVEVGKMLREMRRYDFREEDVVEAFRTSEVRKVHES